MTARARILLPVVLLALGALALWGSSHVTWLEVTAFNDQSGAATRELGGARWQPALVPVALGALAAIAAVALVRGTAARLVGSVVVVLAIAAGSSLASTVGRVDRDRVHATVTADFGGAASTSSGTSRTGGSGGDDQALPAWSEITDVTATPLGPGLAGLGALLVLCAGLVMALRPAPPRARDDRYTTPATRRARAVGDSDAESAGGTDAEAGTEPDATAGEAGAGGAGQAVETRSAATDTNRELWDALDEGEDPTR